MNQAQHSTLTISLLSGDASPRCSHDQLDLETLLVGFILYVQTKMIRRNSRNKLRS
jgi:hypothetical protein